MSIHIGIKIPDVVIILNYILNTIGSFFLIRIPHVHQLHPLPGTEEAQESPTAG